MEYSWTVEHSTLPWLAGANLNEILFNYEKNSGPTKPQSVLNLLCISARSSTYVICVPWGSQDTTSPGETVKMARTLWKKGLIDSAPTQKGVQGSQTLESSTLMRTSWITSPLSSKPLKASTRGERREGGGLRIYGHWMIDGKRVKHCMEKLSAWSLKAFGHIQSELRKFQGRLKLTSDAGAWRAIFQEISQRRKKEEVLWWQRTRTDFLKFEDRNSSWFHQKANARRQINQIAKLEDAQGNSCSDPKNLGLIIPLTILDALLTTQGSDNAKLSEFVAIMLSYWNSRIAYSTIVYQVLNVLLLRHLNSLMSSELPMTISSCPRIVPPRPGRHLAWGSLNLTSMVPSLVNGEEAREPWEKIQVVASFFPAYNRVAVSRELSLRRPMLASSLCNMHGIWTTGKLSQKAIVPFSYRTVV
ncbi:hypothetical protein Cgig2_009843 [Carnegiea gigantea]|uniref:Uncharacterized protein n=1 Tax=Carnegiea gigantea TaxID=171969 RepID=A0A9Q1KN84_9CARY|nr:hypothetical protein Cgig2_009843 [Carnegiea gigantea]